MLAMVMDLGGSPGGRLRPAMVVRDACARNSRADAAPFRLHPAAANADAEPVAGWFCHAVAQYGWHHRSFAAGGVSDRQRPRLLRNPCRQPRLLRPGAKPARRAD